MDDLTKRLTTPQPVEVGGPKPTLAELRNRLEDVGIVFVKFTETRGSTDLGIRVDREACDLTAADFEQGSGTVHVEGTLILNDDPVRCIAEFDLATLKGTARLAVVAEAELVAR